MATTSEKKALIFLSALTLLGVGARLWRLQHPSPPESLATTPDSSSQYKHGPKTPKYPRKNARSKAPERRDSTSVVDLDRASIRDIEALGVLKPGVARLIIADRDSFGPFGSLHELERVPYLDRADFRSLAPRVTFSLLPRPKNAVMQPHVDQVTTEPIRRRRRTGTGAAR